MTIDVWCQNNNFTRANYYWRFQNVREAFLEAVDVTPTFVELTQSVAELVHVKTQEISTTTIPKIMTIVKKEYCAIEITNQASVDFLHTLLEVQNHA